MATWPIVPPLTSGPVTSTWTAAVKDSADFGSRYRHRARVHRVTPAGPIGSGGGQIADCTSIALATVEFDNAQMADGTGLIIPDGGVWDVGARVAWPFNGGGNWRSILIRDTTSGNTPVIDADQTGGWTSVPTGQRIGGPWQFIGGEVLRLQVAQSSGAPLTFGAAWYYCCMWATAISG